MDLRKNSPQASSQGPWYGDKAQGGLDPERLHYELVTVGMEWAEAQAAYDLLYETKKILLAKLKASSGGKSEAERESRALASPEYMEHIAAMNKAAKKAMELRVKYDSLKTYIDMLRSKMALQRAEMQLV